MLIKYNIKPELIWQTAKERLPELQKALDKIKEVQPELSEIIEEIKKAKTVQDTCHESEKKISPKPPRMR